MTREEARRLLSGYATGSLTELEQQLLFDAALEDQELFDELATEQAVKELIELPGAKRRLLEALGPEKKQLMWWPWAVGVAAAVIGVAVWVSWPAPAPVEIAKVEAPTTIEVAPAAPATVDPTALTKNSAELADKLVAPTSVEPRPAPIPEIKEEVMPVPAELEARARQQLPVLRADVPTPQPAAPAKSALLPERQEPLLRTGTAAAERTEDALKQIPITTLGATNGKAKAFAAPAPAKPAAVQMFAETAALAVSAAGGTLSYEVRNTGILRMTATRAGVVSVTFDGRPLYPSTPVAAGATIDVSIPLEARQLRIDYAGDANDPGAAAQNGGIEGTLTLPGGTGRAVIVIPAQR